MVRSGSRVHQFRTSAALVLCLIRCCVDVQQLWMTGEPNQTGVPSRAWLRESDIVDVQRQDSIDGELLHRCCCCCCAARSQTYNPFSFLLSFLFLYLFNGFVRALRFVWLLL